MDVGTAEQDVRRRCGPGLKVLCEIGEGAGTYSNGAMLEGTIV